MHAHQNNRKQNVRSLNAMSSGRPRAASEELILAHQLEALRGEVIACEQEIERRRTATTCAASVAAEDPELEERMRLLLQVLFLSLL